MLGMAAYTYNTALQRDGSRIPGAHWPSSLAELVTRDPKERLRLKNSVADCGDTRQQDSPKEAVAAGWQVQGQPGLYILLGVVTQAFNMSTQEADARESL